VIVTWPSATPRSAARICTAADSCCAPIHTNTAMSKSIGFHRTPAMAKSAAMA
jgi:hypothetical protein